MQRCADRRGKSSEQRAEVLRALAHPTRLGILEHLLGGPAGPVDYVDAGGEETLGTVSHHFRKLREAGLITLAATEQRRGAIKSTYRLSARGRKALTWLDQG